MKFATSLKKIKWSQVIIVAIILVATILRFYALDRADVLTDEASVSFRSIGYFDWLATPYQTTPLEWLDFRPWWSNLSFHDHPALSFLLQFLQFKITGISVFAMRFWPAFYGVITVWVLYLIAKKLFDQKVGLLAAGLLAVSNLHIWISRLALQESLTILMILLSFYVFLKALDNKKFFYLLGLLVGLSLLVKLTAIILLPIIFSYLLIWRRDIFSWKEIYFAFIIFFAVWSPYWIYNFLLFKNFGHFDFQWSWLFHQNVSAWQIRPGRLEVPEKSLALFYTFGGLKYSLSPIFFWLANISLVVIIIRLFKKKFSEINLTYLSLIILFHFILFIFIGTGARFLSLIIPWLCILVSLILIYLSKYFSRIFIIIILSLLFFADIFFSYNTCINFDRWGKENITYSPLKSQAYPYGYNQLEPYLDSLLANKKPEILLPVINPNINNFIQNQADKMTGEPSPIMIIYDQRMQGESILWFLTRRFLYQGWPVLSYDVYKEVIDSQGSDFFRQMGLTDFYFVSPTEAIPLNLDNEKINTQLDDFQNTLENNNIGVDKIFNYQNKEVFSIYHWQ